MSTQTQAQKTVAAALAFDALVPRRLVHRAAVGEVFLTDAAALGEDRFVVAAQLPRTHSFFSDRLVPYYDPLLMIEVARQAALLIAHRYYEVPEGSAFIFHSADLAVTDVEAHRIKREPSELLIDVELKDKQSRDDGGLAGTSLEFGLTTDGVEGSRARGSMLFMEPQDFAGLRLHVRARKGLEDARTLAVPEPAEPGSVGRRDRRNVVIAEPVSVGQRMLAADVRVDQGHPCLFDHELDHVPGMLLLEAYRQAGVYAAARVQGLDPSAATVTRCRARFKDFAELELAISCEAAVGKPRPDGAGPATVPVQLRLVQGGCEISKGLVEVTPCP